MLSAVAPRVLERGTLAAPATPPAPPTYVPPTIGEPPMPPTFTPLPGATASPSATPSATTVSLRPSFSLQAARVSTVGSPADLRGLVAVKPGSHVWLMMYFTLWHMPVSARRISTYEIDFAGKVVYRVAFAGKFKAGVIGRFSRYTAYTVPSSMRLGNYVFRARLTVGKHTQTKLWPFAIAHHQRVVSGTQ